MNIAGITIMFLFVLIFGIRMKKRDQTAPLYIKEEEVVIRHDHEELGTHSTVNETEMFDPFQKKMQ